MGDRLRVRLPRAALYFGTEPATQVDSAFYSQWDGKMSTSQRTVMLCGLGVKAGVGCLQVKLCVAMALYKCPGLLLLLLY